jgi:DNA-directed RNA polymerase specialized sigma24 family protein
MAQKSYTARLSSEIDAAYEAYKKAEPDAVGRLYSALLVQARNIVFFRLGFKDEDVALEIVYRALGALSEFRGKSKLSTWFYRLAKNEGYRALDTHIRTPTRTGVHCETDCL